MTEEQMYKNDVNLITINAVQEQRAVPLSLYRFQPDSKTIDNAYIKHGREIAHSCKRESFYLGFLSALDLLGADEMMSAETRTELARVLTVEARKFLTDREIIKAPCWIVENK